MPVDIRVMALEEPAAPVAVVESTMEAAEATTNLQEILDA
jgi:hypothetical protein